MPDVPLYRIVCLLLLLCSTVLAEVSPGAPGPPPLTLQEAIDTALRQNPQVLSAQGNYQAAAARIWEQRSNWLPQLISSSQFNANYIYQTGPLPASSRPDTSSARYSSTLQLQQLIYDFGHTSGLINFATASARAAAGDRQTTRAQIALGAITAYYAVLQAEALNDVAVRNLDQQEQKLLQAEGFYHIGTKAEIDVLTAKTARAQAQLQLTQARNGIITSRIQLLLAMGVTDPSWMARRLSSGAPGPLPEEGRKPEELLDVALSHRPEYAAQRDRVAAQEAQIVVARSGYFPTLSVQGNLGVSGSTTATLNQATGVVQGGTNGAYPQLTASGLVLLRWQFFDGLQTPYTVREQRALLDVAHANLEALRQQVKSGVEQGVVAVDSARESLVAAQAVVDQAELQLQAATGRYKEGVGSIIELGDAQVAVVMARQQKVQADFNLAVARAQLQMQLGELLSPESDKQPRKP